MLVAAVRPRAARLFSICVPLLAIAFWTEPAHAYNWMIRHGYGGCVTCHVDPSGGELLTPYGRVQSDLVLRMRYGKDSVSAASSQQGTSESFDSFDSFDESDSEKKEKPKAEEEQGEGDKAEGDKGEGDEAEGDKAEGDKAEGDKAEGDKAEGEQKAAEAGVGGPSESSGFLWGLIEPPDWLLLGGSIRLAQTLKDGDYSAFPMQLDLYGGLQFGVFRAEASIGLSYVDVGSPHARAAQVTTGQGHDYNLISRTHWLGVDIAGGDVLLRAGRINLPYGLRIPEHTMWVREATQTDRESDQDHGVALAYNGSSLRGEIMAIAGNYQVNPDGYRERGGSMYLEGLLTDEFALGVSALATTAKLDRVTLDQENTVRQAYGITSRMVLAQPVVVLFEADVLLRSRRESGYVGFLQTDLEFIQGLHFMLTGEALDNGAVDGEPRSDGFGKPRFGGWISLDWFFLPHMEARVDAIFRTDDPFTLLSQIHVFL
jgi:hypothetical protein